MHKIVFNGRFLAIWRLARRERARRVSGFQSCFRQIRRDSAVCSVIVWETRVAFALGRMGEKSLPIVELESRDPGPVHEAFSAKRSSEASAANGQRS
jgi:hypothetical protein